MRSEGTLGGNAEMLARIRKLATDFAVTYPLSDRSHEYPAKEMNKLKESGILAAAVPTEYGGLGMSADELIRCVMILAEGNPSIAQMFLVHCVIGAQFISGFASESQKKHLFGQIVNNHAFIANAASEKESKDAYAYETTLTRTSDNSGVRINGTKFFCTGSKAADIILVLGIMEGAFAAAFVSPHCEGLVMRGDWDVMGQRGTSSGSIEFKDVYAAWDMVIPKVGIKELEPSNLFGPLTQGCFTAIYVGAAKAALNHALRYVKTRTRPLSGSGVSRAIEDPYILQETGKMSAYTSAAESLLLKAAALIDRTLEMRGLVKEQELAQQRAEASVAVSEAKVFATEAGLRVCQDVFQVCGARAALAEEDLDRYWRDVRTLTLHDPAGYKAKQIGEFLLQGKFPDVSLRS